MASREGVQVTEFYDSLASTLALLILFVGPLTVAGALESLFDQFINREE